MASISNISGNTFLLNLSSAESINLFFIDFATGYVSSSYIDSQSCSAISTSITPVLNGLTAPQKSSGALSLLLSCVTVAGINGSLNLSATASGAGYSLTVTSVTAIAARVTIAHTVQGGFVGGESQNATPSGSSVNAAYFTSSGTWTKPAGVTWVRVFAYGGGGGGGSGRVDVAGTDRFGGDGGDPGSTVDVTFLAANVPASVPVTIGAGGAGAVGTAGTGDGSFGDTGGDTLFGISPVTGITQVRADGGAGGNGGSSVAVASAPFLNVELSGLGQGYPNPMGVPFAFGTVGNVSAIFQNASYAQTSLGPAGGGCGGSIDAANTPLRGMRGQIAVRPFTTSTTARGVAGTVPGGAGTAGSQEDTAVLALFGIGAQHGNAGGGAGDAAGTINGGAGASASGTYGTGGGGGAAATNPATSGAGGTGGNGYLAVLSW